MLGVSASAGACFLPEGRVCISKKHRKKLILEEDAIVYTSGSGGNFRAGLPIGKINNEIENLAVQFFSDLSQLSYVKIQTIKIIED